MIVGNGHRYITSQELHELDQLGAIERDMKTGHLKWYGKRTLRFIFPEIRLRDLAAKYGPYHAEAIREAKREINKGRQAVDTEWALAMQADMRQRPAHTIPSPENVKFREVAESEECQAAA